MRSHQWVEQMCWYRWCSARTLNEGMNAEFMIMPRSFHLLGVLEVQARSFAEHHFFILWGVGHHYVGEDYIEDQAGLNSILDLVIPKRQNVVLCGKHMPPFPSPSSVFYIDWRLFFIMTASVDRHLEWASPLMTQWDENGGTCEKDFVVQWMFKCT